MLFNSYTFLLFFWPLTWLVHRLLARRGLTRPAIAALVLASWFFYAWWRPTPESPRFQHLPLLLGSILFNFFCGKLLANPRTRSRLWLGLAVTANLALLGYWKYLGLFASTLRDLAHLDIEVPSIILPIAISFFTFQQIAYLVDSYREQRCENNFWSYSLFVSFFSQLIAGPIVHHKAVMPQFNDPRNLRFSSTNVATGLMIFAIGLFKKVVIADHFGPMVSNVFELAQEFSFFDAWGATLGYFIQLYFDFSGYADMAVGIGLTFNIVLPENFNSPYKSRNITEFWRRWHMTLSTFLRDYLYFPLGGSRRGDVRRYFNLFVTMLLCGMWHGAGWTFALFGAVHGAYMVIHSVWQRLGFRMYSVLAWVVTMFFFMLSLAVFRARDLAHAGELLVTMFGFGGFAFDATIFSVDAGDFRALVPALLIVFFAPNRQEIMARGFRRDRVYAVVFSGLMVVSLLHMVNPSPFLYFQF
jgi:D-alanyl-lipoteichoic acid acyltransferase DltB (MBOAT superfamily)